MSYVWAFVVGGAICVVGQLFIDYTKLSPARILTGYVVAGVILSAVGLYKPLADFAGAGASVPLLGFGNLRQNTDPVYRLQALHDFAADSVPVNLTENRVDGLQHIQCQRA